jgi:hypothetical protein
MFMETTEVAAEKSAGEIVQKLVSIGARRVSMTYDEDRRLSGVDFTLAFGRLELPFAVPARIELLIANPRFAPNTRYDRTKRRTQAERVAWRQLFRWIEAQCALIETGMVSNIEVFTAYRITGGRGDGPRQTLYEAMIETDLKLLRAAPDAGEGLT